MRLTAQLFSIMRVILSLLGLCAFFSQALALTYIAPPVAQEVKACDVSVEECVRWFSTVYGVSYLVMINVILCENRELDPKLQSRLRYSFSDPSRGIYKGEREKSYGISQIHLPSHPNVTLEQATDTEFSVEFMAKAFSKGKQGMWSCYKKLYK